MRCDVGVQGVPKVGVGNCVPFDLWPASSVAEGVEWPEGECVCECDCAGMVCLWKCEYPRREFRALCVERGCEFVPWVEVRVSDCRDCGVEDLGAVCGSVSECPSQEPPVARPEPAFICGVEGGRLHPVEQLWKEDGVEDPSLPLWGNAESPPESL